MILIDFFSCKTTMKLTATQKRALVLLNRGIDAPFFSLQRSTHLKMEKAGYINADAPNLVTSLGLSHSLKK